MTFAHSLIIAALLPAADHLIKLSRPDIAIIAIYFAVVLGIGMYLKNYAKSGEDFFMAGREMTAWVAGLSFISANLGAIELIGWAASAYEYGILAAHAYWIAAFPAIVILALVMMPFYYISKTHSVPGYLQLRYGEGARALSGISFAVMTVLMSGINMYAMALVMKVVVGWNIHFSIWVSSLTVAIYVVLGGLFSAIFNEVLQFFLIWLGALLIPILGLVEVGGWSGMVARIHQNFPGGDYTHLWRTLGTFTGNPWASIGPASFLAWGEPSPAGTGLRISWWCSGRWQPKISARRKWRPLSALISRWQCPSSSFCRGCWGWRFYPSSSCRKMPWVRECTATTSCCR